MSKTKRAKPMPRIAEVIRQIRTRTRLSQAEFAEAAGISKGHLGTLETGYDRRTGKPIRPSVDVLRAISTTAARDIETGDDNPERADRYYRDLADAAGYFPASVTPAPALPPTRRVTPQQRIYAVLSRFPQLTTTFDAIPDDVDEADVEMVIRHAELSVNQLRRSRGLPPIQLDM